MMDDERRWTSLGRIRATMIKGFFLAVSVKRQPAGHPSVHRPFGSTTNACAEKTDRDTCLCHHRLHAYACESAEHPIYFSVR